MSIDEKLMTEYHSFAEELAEAAAAVIRPHFRTPLAVEDKGGNLFDPVTVADRDAERIMRTMIQDRYPGHGVSGEEEGRSGGRSPLTWVLDPIDGTRLHHRHAAVGNPHRPERWQPPGARGHEPALHRRAFHRRADQCPPRHPPVAHTSLRAPG